MAKSPQQIIELERQHVERSKEGFQSAKLASNASLLALNLGQVFRGYLMQGLIGWRCGISSPVNAFREALDFVRQGYPTWQSLNGSSAARIQHVPLETGLFLAFLVNENTVAFDQKELVADRLLDAVLGRALRDEWDGPDWSAGLDQLQNVKGSALAVEVYTTYQLLLRATDLSGAKSLVDTAVSLFNKRKKNAFYSGGEATDGGGYDNAITVDYRLAAIMKKIGYKGDLIHSWKWE